MDELCDWSNNHDDESPESLFLTCVILWFSLDGEKNGILGLRVTIFSRHTFCFSIGRALHVGTSSIMVTGWSKKLPDSLSQYDDS
jgi:hypothetical protein